jgi:16S rRNA (guanine527-N7)-methyltransferase
LLEYAAPLLKVGGALVAWKGSPDQSELETAEKAALELGFGEGTLISTKPFAKSRSRHFYVAEKVSETPDRFPRRAGMAIKRPLGA